jgi:dGTPase
VTAVRGCGHPPVTYRDASVSAATVLRDVYPQETRYGRSSAAPLQQKMVICLILAYHQSSMIPLADRIAQANSLLSPYAVPHEGRLGRKTAEAPDPLRFPFQIDRDRILHSTAFRRLQGKTQVFVTGEGDHYRTRLTHTLEVAQISRDIARVLGLNEDLSECIALAHDLGHPPFGHSGEAALNEWMAMRGEHFEHNEQSYRIVTILENRSSLYEGLNLNREVEDGLLKHSTIHPTDGRLLKSTLEAQVANIADEIAYVSHDCDDALMAHLFPLKELISIPLARDAHARAQKRGTHLRGSLVHLLTTDLIESSETILQKASDNRVLGFSPAMRATIDELRMFLAERMYSHPRIRNRSADGQRIVRLLCDWYIDHPIDKIFGIEQRTGASRMEAVKDYVAGMTDNFAWLQAAEQGLIEELTMSEVLTPLLEEEDTLPAMDE